GRQIDQNKSLVNDIICILLQPGLQRIRLDDLDIAEAAVIDLHPCHFHETRLSFNADDLPLRANTLSQQVHDPNRPATDVNGTRPSPNGDPVEHPCCEFLEALRLSDKSLLFLKSATKRIGDGEGRHPSSPKSLIAAGTS